MQISAPTSVERAELGGFSNVGPNSQPPDTRWYKYTSSESNSTQQQQWTFKQFCFTLSQLRHWNGVFCLMQKFWIFIHHISPLPLAALMSALAEQLATPWGVAQKQQLYVSLDLQQLTVVSNKSFANAAAYVSNVSRLHPGFPDPRYTVSGLPKRTCIPSNSAFAPNHEVALQLNIEPPVWTATFVEATEPLRAEIPTPLRSLDSTRIYTQKHRLLFWNV